MTKIEKIKAPIKFVGGFFTYIKKYGVIGLAIGVVTGGAVNRLVASLVENIINPLVGLALGTGKKFSEFMIGPLKVGAFVNSLLEFLIIMLIIYVVVTIFVNRLMGEEEKKEEKK